MLSKYALIYKQIGETPLSAMEKWRHEINLNKDTPLAYAGRLDPMAEGQLLILIGDECKHQEKYHALDKQYEFSILFGLASDTEDVLGRLISIAEKPPVIAEKQIKTVLTDLVGTITLPFPLFSARTVKGKPLHMWTLENRLNEIEIPEQTSHVYKLRLDKLEQKERSLIYKEALGKINSIPEVTDPRKALGNDFRRVDVRADWKKWLNSGEPDEKFTIAHFTCTASSGTYMRSLALEISKRLDTPALAFSIKRSKIGKFFKLKRGFGFWLKVFK